MKYVCIGLLAPLFIAASAPALADDVASERARLANQRIQIDEERRAREEAERLSQEASQAASEAPVTTREAIEPASTAREVREPATPVSDDVVSDVSAERMEMSRALEQLRELGALRDAGYVTEQEFEQLKKKILDAAL